MGDGKYRAGATNKQTGIATIGSAQAFRHLFQTWRSNLIYAVIKFLTGKALEYLVVFSWVGTELILAAVARGLHIYRTGVTYRF